MSETVCRRCTKSPSQITMMEIHAHRIDGAFLGRKIIDVTVGGKCKIFEKVWSISIQIQSIQI
jgi:hypothetical protein